jgi:hypothetical protein
MLMLDDRLRQFDTRLTEPERNNLRLLLGMAAGDLASTTEPAPAQLRDGPALQVTLNALAAIQPHDRQAARSGILWRGTPPWMTSELLAALQSEALDKREDALRYERQYLSPGASVASSLAVSPEFTQLARDVAGDVFPTGVASYLYYDAEGLGIAPHVDTEAFALNAILMLAHTAVAERKSHLVVYPANGGEPERIFLEPGELALLFADAVVHGRTPVAAGEVVHVLTIGFSDRGGKSAPFTL